MKKLAGKLQAMGGFRNALSRTRFGTLYVPITGSFYRLEASALYDKAAWPLRLVSIAKQERPLVLLLEIEEKEKQRYQIHISKTGLPAYP